MVGPVRVEKKGAVTTVIICRPERRNAVDPSTATVLAKAFEDFDKDPNAKVAILCGEDGTFCAGFDLKALATLKTGASGNNYASLTSETFNIKEYGPMGPSRFVLSKPVIAAINGFAVAGGLELALFCDMRVVEEDAVMGVFCRRWGVPLIDGGTVRLPRLIGLSRAMDLILTGRPVNAQEALQIGLANRVVSKGKAREEAEKLALLLCNFPQDCMRRDRISAYNQFDVSYEDAMKFEFEQGVKTLKEASEGAFKFASGEGRGGSFQSFLPKL